MTWQFGRSRSIGAGEASARHGRQMRFGKLPVTPATAGLDNLVKPGDVPAADGTLRLQVRFPFPK